MTDKKNTPSSHGESKEKETLDSLAIAAFKDLVNSVQSEIKPYLATEGEQVLGNEVSVNRASLIKINQALATRNEAYEQALILLKEQNRKIVNLTKENKLLKKGYEELCHGYDNLKNLIHEISVKQKNHVERSDGNFLRIDKILKSLGFGNATP